MKEENVIRERLTFTGRVQGVGFRYRAKHTADSVGVTGWVTNEWDGSVVMEAPVSYTHLDVYKRQTLPLYGQKRKRKRV